MKIKKAKIKKPTARIVQLYTGDGKGKTTAAIGQAIRAAGAGKKVAFFQFLKGGKFPVSEEKILTAQDIRPRGSRCASARCATARRIVHW